MIDISAVEAALATAVIGRPVQYSPSVASTQELARAAAQAGAPEGLAVLAGQQTAGRGRAGRAWWSPPAGGLYLSLLLRPRLAAEYVSWLTMCLALGTAEAVQDVCGLRPGVKWPNDLEVNGRKLAGILCEGAFQDDRLSYVIAGLGLNVALDFSSRPDLAGSATSLQAELGQPVDLTGLVVAVLTRIEDHYLALQQGVSPQPAWASRLATLGQPVQAVGEDGRIIRGLASAVLPDGALCIRLVDGRQEIVRAMDVTVRVRQD